MLNDSATTELLDIYSPKEERLVSWRQAIPRSGMCAPHRPPGNDCVIFGDLAIHGDNKAGITLMPYRQVLAKPSQPFSFSLGRCAIKSQKLRQTICRTRVNHLLQEPACE